MGIRTFVGLLFVILRISNFIFALITMVFLFRYLFLDGELNTFCSFYFSTILINFIVASEHVGIKKLIKHPFISLTFLVFCPIIMTFMLMASLYYLIEESKKAKVESNNTFSNGHIEPKKNNIGKRRNVNGHYYRRGDQVQFYLDGTIPIKGEIVRINVKTFTISSISGSGEVWRVPHDIVTKTIPRKNKNNQSSVGKGSYLQLIH